MNIWVVRSFIGYKKIGRRSASFVLIQLKMSDTITATPRLGRHPVSDVIRRESLMKRGMSTRELSAFDAMETLVPTIFRQRSVSSTRETEISGPPPTLYTAPGLP